MVDSSATREAHPTVERPHARVYWVAIALLCWLAVPWWMFLGTSIEGDIVFGVCVTFSLIAFGTAITCISRALHTRDPGSTEESRTIGRPTPGTRLRIQTGTVPMHEAGLQILLIPAAVALGFTLLAIVEALAR